MVMKELSIEQKAKRYDEILARATGANLPYYKEDIMTKVREFAEYLLPELAESEDERIRKEIIDFIYDKTDTYELREKSNSWLAWLEKQSQTFTKKDVDDAYLKGVCDAKHELEKQGEQKPILNVEIPFGANDSELIEATYFIPKGFHAEIDGDKVHIKNGEQKPAWSEEDEDMLYKAIAVINRLCAEGKEYVWSVNTLKKLFYWLKIIKDRVQPKQEWSEEDKEMFRFAIEHFEIQKRNSIEGGLRKKSMQEFIDWLKDLRDRIRPQTTWKLSDEQIGALEHFVRSVGESGYASPYDNNTKLLYSLLSDLKKLKG